MAYDPHIRMSLNGVFVGTTEQWSYSLTLGRFDEGTTFSGTFLEPNNVVWDDLADDAADFHGRAASRIGANAELRSIKFAPIGTDGKYSGSPIIKARTVAGGGTSVVQYPTQVALAVTLKTDSPLSRVKGRFYLPSPQCALDASGRVQPGDAQQVRDSVDTFLEAVNNQPGIDTLGIAACVASMTQGGKNFLVNGVTVGLVLDTIRRRRNKQLEAYVGTAAVSP